MKKLLILLFFLGIFFSIGQSVFASIAPPVIIVNHGDKQWTTFYSGDECNICYPPDGWEFLGDAYNTSAPSGYTEKILTEIGCEAFKNQFCCSENHSGLPGDCEDLIINHKNKQCAFVDNIENCKGLLPDWRMPGEEQICPVDYEWLNDYVKCSTRESLNNVDLTEKEDLIDYVVYTIVLSSAVAIALVILWFLFRRTKNN